MFSTACIQKLLLHLNMCVILFWEVKHRLCHGQQRQKQNKKTTTTVHRRRARRLYLVHESVLPQTEDHHEAPVPCSKRGEEVLRVRMTVGMGRAEGRKRIHKEREGDKVKTK